MNKPPDKPSVFISYAHEDDAWRERLTLHLRALEIQGDIVLWDDRKIGTGDDWFPAIQDAMANAAVAVCLISPHFLASGFINKEEIPFLLERRRDEGMLLLPIYVHPCAWPVVRWLGRIQMFPDPKTPLVSKSEIEQDQALADIAVYIHNRISDASFALSKPTPVWAALTDEYVSIERLPKTGSELFGRDDELDLLDNAWESETTRIISFVAWGGVGKSALINKWVEQVAEDNYRGAKRVYAWSFYSQGTGERVTSADMFINDALRFFGDKAMADSNRSGWDKGQRLAELVQKEKTLLLLDGVEPLQSDYEHDRGQIKDPALRVLVEELAKNNPGLCVITTREELPGLDESPEHTVQENLEQISPEAGRALLRIAGIRGSDQELEQATHDFGNHALAVNLLAAYLQDEPDRQIAHARLIPNLDIEDDEGQHPRRMMEAFAQRFAGKPELNFLNMMGLFDRPANFGEIEALRLRPTIPEVTDRIRWLSDDDWDQTIRNLRACRLLAAQSHHDPGGLDAHPLVRLHFGQRLKKSNEKSWKKGHLHLYEYLSKLAPKLPDTLEEMAPLFLAVAHGCKAARHQETLADVYHARIQRTGETNFCMSHLGAIGPDLAALSGFFHVPWKNPVGGLRDSDRGFILGAASLRLQALGRTHEAVESALAAVRFPLALDHWKNASTGVGILSELFLALGEISRALDYAKQNVQLADRSRDPFQRLVGRAKVGEALHQLGRLREAQHAFGSAEQMQQQWQEKYPILYALQGSWYCDLLHDIGECQQVHNRASQTLVWASEQNWLLDIGLDHLMLGRAHLISIQREESSEFAEAEDHLRKAVDGLRIAGTQDQLPKALLGRAEYYRVRGQREGDGDCFDKARRDLDETMTIATRGEMRLHECDSHLEYARLHLAKGEPDEARVHIDRANEMVDEMGYHRRDPDLQLGYTRLLLAEGDTAKAGEHLATAKTLIEEMGAHGHDWEVAELEALV